MTLLTHVYLKPEILLFLLSIFALCCKFYLIASLVIETYKSKSTNFLVLILLLAIGCGMLSDLSWILVLLRRFTLINISWQTTGLFSRIAWSLLVLQYQSFFIILQNLIKSDTYKKILYYLLSMISYGLIGYYIFIAICYFSFHIAPGELIAIHLSKYYLIPLFLPICIETWQLIIKKKLPIILCKQLKIFVFFFIIPQIIIEFINTQQILQLLSIIKILNRHLIEAISLTSSTATLFYCYRRIIGLRFLEIKKHIESKEKFDFINDFKEILEQLSFTTTTQELSHISQVFFQTAFNIPLGRTRLYIRKTLDISHAHDTIFPDIVSISNKVETFLSNHTETDDSVINYLQKNKIFIYDEIEFSNYYAKDATRTTILSFLQEINADIFLPIFERQHISGYIIVEKNARPQQLYTQSERDEMLVFTSYISNTINILNHGKLELLLKKEKELEETLYFKEQEINQYKESIRTFLRTSHERTIGILFYRSRRFIYGNQATEDLLGINVNINQGHPIATTLKKLVKNVQEFKTSQTTITYGQYGKLVLSALPSSETNMTLILVYYPEISDVVKEQFDLLKDPSDRDYILYLETTKSGMLINQLIPGKGQALLNVKIQLLEAALSKKAILINMHEEDLMSTVELLHHISLRQKLYTLKLKTYEKHNEIALKLFGINPIFETSTSMHESILEKLNDIGTLYIENIHFLRKETQQYLADFISYGFFYKYKSDYKVHSNVRIICSTNHNIPTLVNEGYFSKALFEELNETTFSFPSLSELPQQELTELMHGFAIHELKKSSSTSTYQNILELTQKDKDHILKHCPLSLQALKTRVHQLLIEKSNKQEIQEITEFDPAYYMSNPELARAARLGRKALKDRQIMTFLWNKFKNQNKIATLLGVNRSSVNRRCQQYKLDNK